MAGEQRETSYFGRDAAGAFRPRERLRYFDGLFLRAGEFSLENTYHLAARRYLNFLLFNPGRLLHAGESAPPLQISAGPGGSEITISPGAAMLRDVNREEAYEVHLDADATVNLATPSFGFSDGNPIRVSLTFGEQDRDSGTGSASPGGAGVLVPGNDRTVEQAVIVVSGPTDPGPAGPFVDLGTVVFSAAIAAGDVTNTTGRGGLRYEILSTDLLARVGSGPGPATLTGITITPAGALSVAAGSTLTLTANGQFSSGPDRVLTAADGLVWSTGSAGVATVGSTGVVSGVAAGSTTVTATVGAISASRPLTVTAVAVTPVIDGTDVASQASGSPVVITGSNLRDPTVAPGSDLLTAPVPTSVRVFRGAVSVSATVVTALADSSGRQRVRFTMPPRDPSWAANQAVTLELGFGGGTAQRPFAYDD